MTTSFSSVDPTTAATIATYPSLRPAEIEERLARAADTYASWRRAPLTDRSRLLTRVADLLDARRERYARLITHEMGKLLV